MAAVGSGVVHVVDRPVVARRGIVRGAAIAPASRVADRRLVGPGVEELRDGGGVGRAHPEEP